MKRFAYRPKLLRISVKEAATLEKRKEPDKAEKRGTT
jgi:hypothetical protein